MANSATTLHSKLHEQFSQIEVLLFAGHIQTAINVFKYAYVTFNPLMEGESLNAMKKALQVNNFCLMLVVFLILHESCSTLLWLDVLLLSCKVIIWRIIVHKSFLSKFIKMSCSTLLCLNADSFLVKQ